jgi:hypothetical protein
MAFSAMPFWKWALTPQKVSRCPLALQMFLKALSAICFVVTVVVEDADAMLLGEVLKGLLGFYGFLGGELGHQMDVLEPRVVVHKDGGCCVALLGEFPL